MLQVKSVVILKANPGILKHGGGIKMWIWLSVERGSYLGFENRVRMRKIGRIMLRKMLRELVHMAMGQKTWEAIAKVDLCHDYRKLFRIANQRSGENKRDVVGVSCLKDESGAVNVSG